VADEVADGGITAREPSGEGDVAKRFLIGITVLAGLDLPAYALAGPMPPPRDYLQYDAATHPYEFSRARMAWKQALAMEAIETRTRAFGGGNDLDSVKPFTANQTNIRMSSGFAYASELTLDVSPADPLRLAGEGTTASSQGGPDGLNGIYVSTDGGMSFPPPCWGFPPGSGVAAILPSRST